MSQYLWIYPEEEPHSTAEGDHQVDKDSGKEPKEMWPKPTNNPHGSRDHASSVEGKDISLGNAI